MSQWMDRGLGLEREVLVFVFTSVKFALFFLRGSSLVQPSFGDGVNRKR